ncbi:phytoene/squalene synthase family protein [Luteimonas terricola]|uniref:Phytoene synthase n=1 Tax=Luteimonas terricola TaxID=645597 RepID=A0ABQ2EE59_9GAMM|nr:phytoene/squalene synthase family protein [Luteimonas terricola]GGK02564.1 phytoene synthase [Luteimonas terricola]
MSVDVRDDAAAFIDKWRVRWPEWAVAMVFVPKDRQPLTEAWFTLLQEFTDATWGGGDPTPGLAKLAWWQEELGGWAKGARRHPLGALLQPQPAPWLQLGRALPDLRALRGEEGGGAVSVDAAPGKGAGAGMAFAAAVADCEAALFGGRAPDGDAASAVLTSLLGERALLRAAAMDPIAGIDRPMRAGRAGCRPRGVQAALVAARLARPDAPVPPLRALFAAWRGARSAG